MTTQIRQQNGISILEPNGKIVGHSVSELREVILPQIVASDAPRILINFENVNMIDSSGLGTLMEAPRGCNAKKWPYRCHSCRKKHQKLGGAESGGQPV